MTTNTAEAPLPSGSAKAMAMMPIIIPMGDIVGVVFLVIAVQIHYGPF